MKEALQALGDAAESGKGNLLELAVEAARARASLGEISDAIEEKAGRHQAVTRSISGVYIAEYGEEELMKEVRELTDEFAREKEGVLVLW